ncbi:hypothetical protein SDC9_123104 [bioreactor metagenome]|uniref:Uncharacterized protein n=1 Tax=bioreactor metagenome TaxID=1076179 RepID=A0A645CGQ8_9ZZZZ
MYWMTFTASGPLECCRDLVGGSGGAHAGQEWDALVDRDIRGRGSDRGGRDDRVRPPPLNGGSQFDGLALACFRLDASLGEHPAELACDLNRCGNTGTAAHQDFALDHGLVPSLWSRSHEAAVASVRQPDP